MPSALLRASEAHRAQQARMVDILARLVAAQHRRIVAGSNLSDSITEQWLAAMVPLVLAYRERSITLSEGFYARARLLADPSAPALPFVGPEELPREAVETALKVTGIIELVQALNREETPEQAAERARIAAEGAAARQALGGGRSYLDRAYTADRVDMAWYRITREGCCSWCAMQASRGAVFREDSWDSSDARFSGEGDVKGHDNCRCTKGFVLRGEAIPGRVGEYADLWREIDRETPGSNADRVRAFRRAYDERYMKDARD